MSPRLSRAIIISRTEPTEKICSLRATEGYRRERRALDFEAATTHLGRSGEASVSISAYDKQLVYARLSASCRGN